MEKEDEIDFLYISLMKEEGYGVILTSEYKILYFEYNVDDTLDINTKAGP